MLSRIKNNSTKRQEISDIKFIKKFQRKTIRNIRAFSDEWAATHNNDVLQHYSYEERKEKCKRIKRLQERINDNKYFFVIVGKDEKTVTVTIRTN